MLNELKPCPFCGKKEAYLTRNCYGQNYVRCPNCGAVIWGSDDEDLTKKRAVELWNRRLTMPNEWISVKDRLPSKNTKCLCYVGNPYGNYITILTFATDLHKIDKYDFYNQHRSGFCDYDSEYGWAEYENVTHWMPLPKLPKGGVDND